MCTLFRWIFIALQNVGVISAAPCTSTHPLGHNGPVTGSLYLYIGDDAPKDYEPVRLKKYIKIRLLHTQLAYLVRAKQNFRVEGADNI